MLYAVRHRFDAAMFHLVWGQAVHALGAVLEQADTQQAVAGALEGLQAAARCADREISQSSVLAPVL